MSTDISSDKRVADLVQAVGLAAVPLYTWAIPHAQDDATLPADPEEFLSQVAPLLALRGLVSLADAEVFIREGTRLGLIERAAQNRLRFPLAAFYKYQAYVKENRRSDNDEPPIPPGTSTNGQDDPGTSSDFPESPGKDPQVRASLRSGKASDSIETLSESDIAIAGGRARSGKRSGPDPADVDDEFRAAMVKRFGSSLGEQGVLERIEESVAYYAGKAKYTNMRFCVRGSLRREQERIDALNHRSVQPYRSSVLPFNRRNGHLSDVDTGIPDPTGVAF